MSLTQFDSGAHTAQQPEIWTQRLLYEAKEKIFWDRFSGREGDDAPLIVKTDLMAKRGQKVNIDFVSALSASGQSGNDTLVGNEEAATFYALDVSPEYYRHAVAVHKADQSRTIHELKTWGGKLTANWVAAKIDDTVFDAFDASTTNGIFGGDASNKATLEASDKLTPAVISRAKAKMKGLYAPQINVDGNLYYVLIISSYAAYDLAQDSTWREAQRDAGVRGMANPIFSGAMGIWDGVILYVNDRVGTGSDAGSGAVDYAICHMVGGNAMGFAWSMYPGPIMDITDYGAVTGVGGECMFGVAVATFNSVVIGHVPLMVAATDPNA